MTRRPSPAGTAALISAVVALLLTPAARAQRANGDAKPAVAAPALLDQPYEIPSLGMSVYMPEDSLVDLSRLEGGRTTITVRPQSRQQTWVIQIHNSISTDRTLTVDQALENILAQRKAQRVRKTGDAPEETLVRVFDRTDDLFVGATEARRAYVDVPEEPDFPVTGYTLFQTGPGQFVVFQLDCSTRAFPSIRRMYETLVAAVSFGGKEQLSEDRAAALLAGDALLQQFTAEDLDKAAGAEPVFLRVYRPAPGGSAADAEEIAYQRIHARKGFAGEMDPRKKQNNWTSADKVPGWLVRIDARALAGDTIIDTVSLFFLSRDRLQELWSINMGVHRKGATDQWTETGIRHKNKLTVKTTQTGGEPTSADWSPLPSAYISRVETYLLPYLTFTTQSQGIFGFYAYESALTKLTIRRDDFKQNADGSWTVTTLPSENSGEIVSTYSAKGVLLKRVLADGAVTEPIDPERLRRLWADKKLPLN